MRLALVSAQHTQQWSTIRALCECMKERWQAIEQMGDGCPAQYLAQQEADTVTLLRLLEAVSCTTHSRLN